jgi:serine/threonine protein kinase/class 3 adenylate cyclase
MKVGRYELLTQLDAGHDAVAYQGMAPADPGPVEVRILSGAQADDERWPLLCKRLRLAAMVRHPAVIAVRELALEHEPPFVALEWTERKSLFAVEQAALPARGDRSTIPAALELIAEVAGALRGAHLLGLIHGRLSPNTIHVAVSGTALIDFAGPTFLFAGGEQGRLERTRDEEAGLTLDLSCQAPEQLGRELIAQADFPADIYALGAVLFWLLTKTPVPDPAKAAERTLHTASGPDHPDAPPTNRQDSLFNSGITGHKETDAAIERLIVECLVADPSDRPSARNVEDRLHAMLNQEGLPARNGTRASRAAKTFEKDASARAQTVLDKSPVPSLPIAFKDGVTRDRLGRFRLLEKLGHGAMGVVYRAEDATDGAIVAIKVLRPHLLDDAHSLRRFRKEARILAKLNSPFIANLLEVNEDDGLHYIVLEYVTGDNLGILLEKIGRMEEARALKVLADVARGMVDAHERGIIHRDIKPANIWLVSTGVAVDSDKEPGSFRAKLLDFGLARHLVETESLQMTLAGAPVGTPLYMAPEQGLGKPVDRRSDVYAMGATLFHLLTGRPPFEMDDPLLGPVALILKHAKEPLPSPKKLNPNLSDGVCQVLEKALAKSPDARYADAGAMLRDLERLLRGEPTEITLHPRLPACDPNKVYQFDWVWDLQASPAQLWPYVSNTERLNRAATIPPVQYNTEQSPPDHAGGLPRVRLFGQFRKAGFNNVWEEHPFEWVEGRRMGVLREYTQGVFRWLMTVTELEPLPEGGTRLTHRVRIEPRNLIGKLVARLEVGIRGRNSVEKIYRRIDATLTGKLGNPALTDAFEAAVPLSSAQRQRLDSLLGELRKRGVSAPIVEALGQFLANAPPQEVARIRPIALARHLNVDADQFVGACLHAAQAGLLVLLWDLLCPVCRVPSGVKETLRALEDHSRCEVCNLDFPIDFARSVEMIFRANPDIRASELATYCVGGPNHSPHVAVQLRLAAGERMELPLDLPAGAYRIRGPQLPFAVDLRVNSAASGRRLELNLGTANQVVAAQSLRADGQVLCLNNECDQELVVRIERTAARSDALTAARASSLALFRELFPGEVLTAGQLISVATVALLATDIADIGQLYKELGEERVFGLIHEHFRTLEEHIRRSGGALVKTMDERLLAAFDDPVAAVQAAWQIPALLANAESTRNLRLRAGIHRGPAMMATFNDHLDYFGGTVKIALQLPYLAEKGEVVLSEAMANDPAVAAWLRGRGLQLRVTSAELFGGPGNIFHFTAAKEY